MFFYLFIYKIRYVPSCDKLFVSTFAISYETKLNEFLQYIFQFRERKIVRTMNRFQEMTFYLGDLFPQASDLFSKILVI